MSQTEDVKKRKSQVIGKSNDITICNGNKYCYFSNLLLILLRLFSKHYQFSKNGTS